MPLPDNLDAFVNVFKQDGQTLLSFFEPSSFWNFTLIKDLMLKQAC